MTVQLCEGIWQNGMGERLYITERSPVRGQRWTDGLRRYSDDGSWALDGQDTNENLVEHIRPFPQPDQSAEIERLNTVLGEQASVIDSLKESNERLQAEALQAQRYVSDANEKINQQTRTIEHLSDKVRSLERFNDDKESDLDHLRQLRRTNEAIIKELRQLLTYALSKK